MHKWLIIGLAALLLLNAGCMKKSTGAATTPPGGKTAAATREDLQAQVEALPDVGMQNFVQGQAYRANAEDKQKLRELVIQLAPAYDLTFNATTDKLTGLGLSAGVGMSQLVEIMAGKLLKGPNKTDLPNYEPVARAVLAQLQQLSKSKRSASEVEQDLKSAPATPAQAEPLKPARIAVGEWRSVRECRDDKPQLVVEHNDKYYSNMFIFYQGNAVFQIYRDGKIFSTTEYPWKYNAATGELSLIGPNKKPIETLTILEKASEPDQIYVRQKDKMSTTVYRKTGRGNLPITDEERKRLQEMSTGSTKPGSQPGPQPGK